MKNENLYGDAVEPWLGHFLFDRVGMDYSEELFTFYRVCDDLALFLGKAEELVIEVERVKISTYFGYSVKLSLAPSSKRIFLLEREYIEGEESYLAIPFTKATTGLSRKWLSDFKGLTKWPR